ncbi:MAG: hypothetical protein WCF72_13665 [Pseudolabrys sp.]
MSAKTVEVMQAIHGTDVFANYGSLLPLDLQGWNSGHQAFRDIITKNHPAVVIDMGLERGFDAFSGLPLTRDRYERNSNRDRYIPRKS